MLFEILHNLRGVFIAAFPRILQGKVNFAIGTYVFHKAALALAETQSLGHFVLIKYPPVAVIDDRFEAQIGAVGNNQINCLSHFEIMWFVIIEKLVDL